AVLAVGAIFAGYLNFPERERSLGGFLGYSASFIHGYASASSRGAGAGAQRFGVHDPRSVEPDSGATEVMALSAFIAIVGIALAYALHLRDRARSERLAAGLAPLTRLLEAKYWVDEIYQAVIVEPLWMLG